MLYTYFIAALLGRQMLPNVVDRNGREDPDLFFPFFTVLQVSKHELKEKKTRNSKCIYLICTFRFINHKS